MQIDLNLQIYLEKDSIAGVLHFFFFFFAVILQRPCEQLLLDQSKGSSKSFLKTPIFGNVKSGSQLRKSNHFVEKLSENKHFIFWLSWGLANGLGVMSWFWFYLQVHPSGRFLQYSHSIYSSFSMKKFYSWI